jgi:shikimate dehydrogenase
MEYNDMTIGKRIGQLSGNDPLHLQESIFELGPGYRPTINEARLDSEPLSFIVGEHPSAYSVSPLMWNAEFKLRSVKGTFIPIDIPPAKTDYLAALFDVAFAAGAKHFRVLTITNPYKIKALEYFRDKAGEFPARVKISPDAAEIGATNQILVGPDDVFHVINSDGQGMVNAIEARLTQLSRGELRDKSVGVIGAGGAARGILYELAKRVSKGRGSIALFNRTVSKAVELAHELQRLFPGVNITAHPLESLARLAKEQGVLVSSITGGDPLWEHRAYETLPQGTLIVDANYGKNSVLAEHAALAGRLDLEIRDGRGIVVE